MPQDMILSIPQWQGNQFVLQDSIYSQTFPLFIIAQNFILYSQADDDMWFLLSPRLWGPQGCIFMKNILFTSALNSKTKVAYFHQHHLNINYRMEKNMWCLQHMRNSTYNTIKTLCYSLLVVVEEKRKEPCTKLIVSCINIVLSSFLLFENRIGCKHSHR